jgi:hypothetical protein
MWSVQMTAHKHASFPTFSFFRLISSGSDSSRQDHVKKRGVDVVRRQEKDLVPDEYEGHAAGLLAYREVQALTRCSTSTKAGVVHAPRFHISSATAPKGKKKVRKNFVESESPS